MRPEYSLPLRASEAYSGSMAGLGVLVRGLADWIDGNEQDEVQNRLIGNSNPEFRQQEQHELELEAQHPGLRLQRMM